MGQITNRQGGSWAIEFRRNAHDNRPPSRILTSILMGDPDPDRFAKAEAARRALGELSSKGKGVARRDGSNVKPKGKRAARLERDDEADG